MYLYIIPQFAQIVSRSTKQNLYFPLGNLSEKRLLLQAKTKGYALTIQIGEHIPVIYAVIPESPSSMQCRP